jgi:hypothetical protein
MVSDLDIVRFVTFESIHSINGRNNSLLPWLWEAAAGADPVAFQSDMQRTVQALSGMLAGRGVEYSSLKSALVPSGKKRQIAFLYDWYEHPPENYAIAFSRHWLPALRKDIRTSVLVGDLLGSDRPDFALDQKVQRADDAPIRWDTLFAVYFSSLSPTDVELLHTAMKKTPRYRGYLDVTFAGEVRNYLSRTLTFPQVIVGKKIITAHDDDDFVVGSQEPTGYPFAEHGYDVVTVHRAA